MTGLNAHSAFAVFPKGHPALRKAQLNNPGELSQETALHLTRTVKGKTVAETLSSPAARFLICLSFLLDIAPRGEYVIYEISGCRPC